MEESRKIMAAVSKGGSARIDWCDIYKGILISLVVLTHATYEFNRHLNQYTYQFVIAGLFFISGYTAKVRKCSVFEEIVKKFYKLMVPYYVLHLAGLWIFWLFQRTGILGIVSTTEYTVGYGEALTNLLEANGIIYCDWLGAMWFVPVLFLAEAIFMVLTRLFRKDGMLCLVSMLVFLGAEWMAASGVRFYSIDLAGIAQAFLMLGYMARKIKDRDEAVWQLLLKAVCIGVIWCTCVQLGFRYTFDWPLRDVNGLVDFVLPFFGISLTVTVSRLLAKNQGLKRLFVYLGQNSMGIMCFHLVGFKAAYLILILLGQMDAGEAYRLIPAPMMAKGWPLIFAAGIIVSIAIWSGINRIPVVCRLLGGENVGRIYGSMLECRVMRSLKEVYDFLTGLVSKTARQYKEFLKNVKLLKLKVMLCAMCAIGCLAIKLSGYFGDIDVTFPYKNAEVMFEGGWFFQSDTEDYRWFSERAGVRTFLVDQDEFSVRGYIPDTVENITYFSIKVNGEEVYRENVSGGYLIELRLDVSEFVRPYRMNRFEMETDGIRVPNEAEEDQRSFSALVNWIKIY